MQEKVEAEDFIRIRFYLRPHFAQAHETCVINLQLQTTSRRFVKFFDAVVSISD